VHQKPSGTGADSVIWDFCDIRRFYVIRSPCFFPNRPNRTRIKVFDTSPAGTIGYVTKIENIPMKSWV